MGHFLEVAYMNPGSVVVTGFKRCLETTDGEFGNPLYEVATLHLSPLISMRLLNSSFLTLIINVVCE